MKHKIYWNKETSETDPFAIAKRVNACVDTASRADRFAGIQELEYLWVHLVAPSCGDEPIARLETAEWLNVIDEAASLGATWFVVYVGDNFAAHDGIWEISRWAQETHGMQVAFHFTGAELPGEAEKALRTFEAGKTSLFVPVELISAMEKAVPESVRVFPATVPQDVRGHRCENPVSIACVRADGAMYPCGLVVGSDSYEMGHAEARPLADVVSDTNLPHAVEHAEQYPTNGCDGCPSHLSQVVLSQRDQR